METLRVLWLNWRDITSPWAGGAELYTHQVAMRLARKGHEVTLFTSRYPGSLKREQRDGVDIVRRGNASTVYLHAPKFVLAATKSGAGYDVIVDAINTVPFFSPLYSGNAPVVALVYQLTGEIFLREFARPVGHLLYSMEKKTYVPWYLSHADHLVVLSESNKAELSQASFDMDAERISVIPPGVDHDRFGPGPKFNEPTILFMNRLVRYKQPEHIIMAMKKVCARVAESRLIMVGTPVNRRYLTYLRRAVDTTGLESRITFLLPRPFSSSKISLLQGAWVHVLPSIKEGFGLSILEAGACGTPTVGYDVPGLRDAVIQGRTGLLVRPGDTSALAMCLIDLLDDQTRLARLCDGARRWASCFQWERTAERFAATMRVVSRTNRSRSG